MTKEDKPDKEVEVPEGLFKDVKYYLIGKIPTNVCNSCNFYLTSFPTFASCHYQSGPSI